MPPHRPELGPCWLWTGRRNRDGYGLTTWCCVDVAAHRLAYSIASGAVPAGAVVMHACDNPPCCRPEHLSLGTLADNNADAIAKGRARYNPDIIRHGEANVLAKLTDDAVREFRAAWRAGESIVSIARRTGLAIGTVHPMLHGRTWRHVEDSGRAAGGRS